jgi:hypothetical protein
MEAYGRPEYDDPERRVLLDLIIDIVNDLYEEDSHAGALQWKAVADLVVSRPAAHRDQIEYWSVMDHALEDAFAITPLVRELRARLWPDGD